MEKMSEIGKKFMSTAKVWAFSPPFSKVFVTPHVAHSGARYLALSHPLVVSGRLGTGVHVATKEQKDYLDELSK